MTNSNSAALQKEREKLKRQQNKATTMKNSSQAEQETNNEQSNNTDNDGEQIKCSAISTLDRGMPKCDIGDLTEELRSLMLADIEQEPEKYNQLDVDRLKTDPWQTQRYLIRCRLNVKAAHKMMKTSLQFKNSPAVNIHQFPREFYQLGACFSYERDRKENVVVFLRVKLNQKIPIITQYLKSFLFRQIEKADIEANGKGVVLCFDLQGAGVSNVDMEFVYFVMSSLISYFPKGLSYILVHELPWYLRSVWTLARTWLSEDHHGLVKFSNSQTIFEYIEKQNLPDYMGGTCKRDYNAVPADALTLEQAAIAWNIPVADMESVRRKYAKFLPADEEEQFNEARESLD